MARQSIDIIAVVGNTILGQPEKLSKCKFTN